MEMMSSSPSAPPEPITEMDGEDTVHVAVAKDVKESKSVLIWALKNFRGSKICIIHVHQLSKMMIPMSCKLDFIILFHHILMGGSFPAITQDKDKVQAYEQKILNAHLLVCHQLGVRVEKLDIERNNIEEGIVELVDQHKIKRLVMGAAADKHFSRKMTVVKSKKAIFVSKQAHTSCSVWFVCKGFLIDTRKATSDGTGISPFQLPLPLLGPGTRTLQSNRLNHCKSLNLDRPRLTNPDEDLFSRVNSARTASHAVRDAAFTSPEVVGMPQFFLDSISVVSSEWTDNGSSLPSTHVSEKDNLYPYSLNELEEGSDNNEICHLLKQAMAEAENSKREAYEESLRRRKVEKDYIEALNKAKQSEKLYAHEEKQRKEMAEVLARETRELNRMASELEEVRAKLSYIELQKEDLEIQISNSGEMIKELEVNLVSSVELVKTLKEEREMLELERDNAVTQATELRSMRVKSVRSQTQFLSDFSFLDIEEATHGFDQSLIIGGDNGSVYRGLLHSTEVAIKMVQSNSFQHCSEFQMEVDVLRRMRHPNLITLIGVCLEAYTLVFEYLPNGSLEDRLVCKDNTPPLPWQTRIRMSVEICSALIFLHSNKPKGIIHGHLNPANILIDANFSTKLSDFGTFKNPTNGTSIYTDPEFLKTGELTISSDVYSFGIILLQLLTGKPALDIEKKVETALEEGKLGDILDYSAGDWPFVRAKQLAHLAMRCCRVNSKNRPNLGSEVWRILEPMKVLCGTSTSFRVRSEESCRVPSYFVCPILQEIMQDPHIAADGFTYEAEAIKGWIGGGHKTSPMTNLELSHCNLTPNLSLRSAIQEWQQQP
ncbi:hypothetical protein GIB67_037327 [Kingdonia uniflora]|uniref:RING-type E3 ubiquitin transferase n=1 Tax=Kingdonia uniflora TaxID=39325 RepID=A0A7J7MSC6_9MAGN|nr:hypothetical protein GIB67_037327 [Kingdonia uniflora]